MEQDLLKNVWPEWEIVRRIGRGAYGIVYEAVRRDYAMESRAAIKVISIPQDVSDLDSLRAEGLTEEQTRTYLEAIVEDFVKEIRLMETFKGVENIVSVEDYKVIEKEEGPGWDIFIRMELLTPFNSYISDKKLSEEEVICLGNDICSALELCEQRNIIHRDVKPENIFVNQFGSFKLGDFGVARGIEAITGGLSQKGSYNYMAPEMERGDSYDRTVDIYSLGIVLYRMLNKNRLPFLDTERKLLNPGERVSAAKRRLAGEALPAPCEASPQMAELVLKACAPMPADRFQSAVEMKDALNAVSDVKDDPVFAEKESQTGIQKEKQGFIEEEKPVMTENEEQAYKEKEQLLKEMKEVQDQMRVDGREEKVKTPGSVMRRHFLLIAAAIVLLIVLASFTNVFRSGSSKKVVADGERLHPDRIEASSELKPYTDNGTYYTYYAGYVDDGDTTTIWSESDGSDNYGVGEYLDFYLPQGTEVTAVEVCPGHLRREELFWKNSAPSKLKLSSGGKEQILDISKSANSFEEAEKGEVVELKTPVISDGVVRVEIVDVRKGTDWQDTTVSELHLYGHPPK